MYSGFKKIISSTVSVFLILGCISPSVLADEQETIGDPGVAIVDEEDTISDTDLISDDTTDDTTGATTKTTTATTTEAPAIVLDRVAITVDAPVVGTEVRLQESEQHSPAVLPVQIGGPVITASQGADVVAYWVTEPAEPEIDSVVGEDDYDIVKTSFFEGIIEEDTSYYVTIHVVPQTGYEFAGDFVVTVNGDTVQYDQRFHYVNYSILSVTAVAEPEPVFAGLSAILDGQVGMNFAVDPQGVDMSGAYISFAGNKLAGYDHESGDLNDGKYFYQIKVAPYQLADEITATIHYGDKTKVLKTFSPSEYFEELIESGEITGKEKNISMALLNYAYYSQVFLSEYNGWVIGRDHVVISVTDIIRNMREAHDSVKNVTGPAQISSNGVLDSSTVATRLNLGATVTMAVRFKLAEGVDSDSVDIKVNGQTYQADSDSSGYYYVYISDIYASRLASMNTIVISSGSSSDTISVSPMTYAHSVLSDDDTDDKLKDLVCAMCVFALACTDSF